jgi:hypothetical protein
MPDVASRAFLAAVVEASRGWGTAAGGSASLSSQWQQQGLPVLGLVDWNPGGVGILLAYKYGCAAMGLESARYVLVVVCLAALRGMPSTNYSCVRQKSSWVVVRWVVLPWCAEGCAGAHGRCAASFSDSARLQAQL